MELGRLSTYKTQKEAVDVSGGHKKDPEMAGFFDRVSLIRENMKRISEIVKEIRRQQSRILESPSIDERTKYNREMDALIDEVSVCSNRIKDEMKIMEEENGQMAEKHGPSDHRVRIRDGYFSQLINRFIDVMNGYQNAQISFNEKYNELLLAQYKIVNPEATADDLHGLMEGGDLFDIQVFKRQDAEKELKEMEDRKKNILQIEKRIIELSDLFKTMATNVQAHGETINRIEAHLELASDYMESAMIDVEAAVHTQKSRRRCFF